MSRILSSQLFERKFLLCVADWESCSQSWLASFQVHLEIALNCSQMRLKSKITRFATKVSLKSSNYAVDLTVWNINRDWLKNLRKSLETWNFFLLFCFRLWKKYVFCALSRLWVQIAFQFIHKKFLSKILDYLMVLKINSALARFLWFDVLVYPLAVGRHFSVYGGPPFKPTKVAERNNSFDDPVVFEAHQWTSWIC